MIKRLWIVISVPWTAFWCGAAFNAIALLKEPGPYTTPFGPHSLTSVSLWIGVFPWILLLIVPPVARWVFTGNWR
ncbi:MAG: hypothetical protein ABFD89_29555 [Bryobacteraceae bacterium]